jgi:polysaccharide biosynthesis/export protein
MKLIRTVLLLAFPLYFISCGTQKKMPDYLERITDSSDKKQVTVPELRIQKNDILAIQVYSASTDIRADELYNLRTGSSASGSAGSNSGGFLVDARGNIEYPRVGTIHAEGLTKNELGDIIKRRINEKDSVLTDPAVIIRFLNFKITVLGEVVNQGEKNIPGERITILEAVGLAGGISDEGMKNAVKIIRETDGKIEIGKIDLSSDSLFISPYYNLKQNDVVLVQPTRNKIKKEEQDRVVQRVSFGLSLITAIALLYNIFR